MKYLLLLMLCILAPAFTGIINSIKAIVAGKRGPGMFRLYADIAKLLGKNSPRSNVSTFIFALAPLFNIAATLAAAAIFACGFAAGGFAPELAVGFFGLLGAARFSTVLGALDVASSFEGMGASREIHFSAVVEPALYVILGFLALVSTAEGADGRLLLLAPYSPDLWLHRSVSLMMAGISFYLILLLECARVPFDDPETHLELTMIHEAMVLDSSGPDLAFIQYAAALKFTLLSAFLAAMVLPGTGCGICWRSAQLFGSVAAIAVFTGIVESVRSRLRLAKIPQLLTAMLMTAALAVMLYLI